MTRPLVIIHGWSDNATSFKPLAQLLEHQLNRSPQFINLANYISLDDEVTFADLVAAMSNAWLKQKLPTSPAAVDVVVHSTGGLIIRDWLTHYFTPETAPIKHLLMLAPANFGSPLAHKGQAFIGRVVEGFNGQKDFQVGEKLLKGLELASPYSWQLAMRDRFGPQEFYGPGKILCTVLVGNTGYNGISAAANEDGTDGTVRVSTANLNCAYLTVDFYHDPLHPKYSYKVSNGATAFAVIPDENHSTIAGKYNGPRNPLSVTYMKQALEIEDQVFLQWCDILKTHTEQVMLQGAQVTYTHGFQNTVCFVQDQFNQHVQDYFMEFFCEEEGSSWFEDIFHRNILGTTHPYSKDSSYRSLYVDCTLLAAQLTKDWQAMNMSLTAMPQISRNKNVGYCTFTDKDIGSIAISKQQVPELFMPNRTLLVEILLRRQQADNLFIFQNNK